MAAAAQRPCSQSSNTVRSYAVEAVPATDLTRSPLPRRRFLCLMPCPSAPALLASTKASNMGPTRRSRALPSQSQHVPFSCRPSLLLALPSTRSMKIAAKVLILSWDSLSSTTVAFLPTTRRPPHLNILPNLPPSRLKVGNAALPSLYLDLPHPIATLSRASLVPHRLQPRLSNSSG
jgi:hypothetical protein